MTAAYSSSESESAMSARCFAALAACVGGREDKKEEKKNDGMLEARYVV
jgi:hypothetical protein